MKVHERNIKGWKVQWGEEYPLTLIITCPKCGHQSIRIWEQVFFHTCPSCGRQGAA